MGFFGAVLEEKPTRVASKSSSGSFFSPVLSPLNPQPSTIVPSEPTTTAPTGFFSSVLAAPSTPPIDLGLSTGLTQTSTPSIGEPKILPILKSTGQSVARNIASAGLTASGAIQSVAKGQKVGTTVAEPMASGDIQSFFGQALFENIFGKGEDIKPVEQRIAEAEPKIKAWQDELAKTAQTPGLSPHEKFITTVLANLDAPALAFTGIMGSVGLDLSGFGGLEKNAVKALIKATTEGDAIIALTKMGVSEDLARNFAQDVVKVSTEKEAKALFNNIAKFQQTTKEVPGYVPVVGVKPDLSPLAKEASWSRLQKTNPDLFNTGILRKSQAPYKAVGEIPVDVHTAQAKWQNYGQNDEIPAETLYGKSDSYGYYNDKNGNSITDIKTGNPLKDTFDDNTGEKIPATISNEQLKKNLLDTFSTKEGKAYLGQVIDVLPKNPDGTITAYRIGSIGEKGTQSYTLSEGMAKTFSNQGTDILPAGTPGLPKGGYKDFGVLPPNIVKIDPRGIVAWSPYDAEILVESKYVKTKSQLTDFYNKVKTGAPKTAEKSKPISLRGNTVLDSGKTVKQTFRTDKLDISLDQIKGIEDRLTSLGLTERSIRSFEDIQKAAQALGTDLRTLLREVSTGRITDKEVVALRNLISSKAAELVKLQKELEGNPVDERILNIKINNANAALNEAIKKLVKGGTEAGRTVAAFRIIAEKTLEPTYWFTQAEKMLGLKEFTPEIKAGIIDLINKKDLQGLATFVSMLRNATLAEKAVTLWKAGLLTSPTTHIANISGNIVARALLTASDIPSTTLDILASLVTGKRTVTITPRTVGAAFKGLAKGTVDAKEFFKTGRYSEDLFKKYNVQQVNFKNKILQGYTDAVFRSLGAEDLIFRRAAIEESFVKEAILIAKNEGLHGAEAKARVGELLTNPTNEMIANSIDAAEHATFQKKNALAGFIQGGKRGAGKFAPVAEFVVPFTTTPSNIAEMIMDFSPAGFVRAIVRFARPSTRSQKDLVERLGKAITGTGIIAFGSYLAAKGLMTGNAPTNASEAADFYAEGKQPHAINFMGHWFRLDRVSPPGNLLALGADFYQLSKTESGVGLVAATAAQGLKGLTQMTFLQGLSNALSVVSDPEREAKKYVERGISSLIPSVIGRTATTINPTLKIPDGIWQAVEARIPFLSKGVPVRRDIFGYTAPAAGGRLNLIDPFSNTKEKNSPIIDEAKRIGVVIGLPSQTVSGEKMTNAEYSLYQKVQGAILEKTLGKLIESGEYKSADIQTQQNLFDAAKRQVRSLSNQSVFSALMIKKYNLPKESNPQILNSLLTELNSNDQFQNLPLEKKSKVLNALLLKAGS